MSVAGQPDADVTALPLVAKGMRIGLFGGSFNPAHEGHRLVALQCLRRLRLDRVWLLVSPGNPLKDNEALPSLTERVRATRDLMQHPDIEVTGFEAAHGFRYSFETVRFLAEHPRGARFVWIMGADNLVQFDRWERWRDIAAAMPVAVYARPGFIRQATASPAALSLRSRRIPESEAETLADRDPPVWVYLHGITSPQSSTAIRASRKGAGE